jgi:N-formylglutamate amidohydrolase
LGAKDASDDTQQSDMPAPFRLDLPGRQLAPVIYASPHSGDIYPDDLLGASRLPPHLLRKSEDSFVDQLFAAAPAHGSPLLSATYGRVYLDPNREPWELDPSMFADSLPAHINTTSLRVAGGLGTVARVVADGHNVYGRKLRFSEVERRVHQVYFPYHQALTKLVMQTRREFGYCLLIDCHSMPSTGGPMDNDDGRRRADIVLGDRFGTTCAPELTDCVQQMLSAEGLVVMRNNPYAGGFTTYNYGRPAAAIHAMQIEINRALYMDEQSIEPNDGFARVRDAMTRVIDAIRRLDPSLFEHLDTAAE